MVAGQGCIAGIRAHLFSVRLAASIELYHDDALDFDSRWVSYGGYHGVAFLQVCRCEGLAHSVLASASEGPEMRKTYPRLAPVIRTVGMVVSVC